MDNLTSLKVGERAQIVDVAGDDAISMRLMEMGILEGEEIQVVAFAPFGDPIEFLIRGYRVARLRGQTGSDRATRALTFVP